MNYLIASIASFISFAVLDYLWLAKIAKNLYLTELASHITLKDGSLVPYMSAVPFVYIFGILGIIFFVLPKAISPGTAFLYGSLLGLILYGFYDFTNLATLKDYSWLLTLTDTVWGTFLVGAVSAVFFVVFNYIS